MSLNSKYYEERLESFERISKLTIAYKVSELYSWHLWKLAFDCGYTYNNTERLNSKIAEAWTGLGDEIDEAKPIPMVGGDAPK